MNVIVSENVVQAVAGTTQAPKLHQLLAFAWTGRHVLTFEPPTCLDGWLDTIDQGTRDGYRQALARCVRQAKIFPANAATVRIDQSKEPTWTDPEAVLPLDDALDVLNEKLTFLVEDDINDWNFFLGILLNSERERLTRHVENGWAGTVNGGGSGIAKRLQTRQATPHQLLRTALIFDSDRLHPAELKEDWTPAASGIQAHQCAAFGLERTASENLPLRYWRLGRRYIESYMPPVEMRSALKSSLQGDTLSAFEAF